MFTKHNIHPLFHGMAVFMLIWQPRIFFQQTLNLKLMAKALKQILFNKCIKYCNYAVTISIAWCIFLHPRVVSPASPNYTVGHFYNPLVRISSLSVVTRMGTKCAHNSPIKRSARADSLTIVSMKHNRSPFLLACLCSYWSVPSCQPSKLWQQTVTWQTSWSDGSKFKGVFI